MLKKIVITNYRVFQDFTLEFSNGLNILVGNNDAGKSTVLEAIFLALTGRLAGRPVGMELSPFLINQQAAAAYVAEASQGNQVALPEFVVDLYLEERDETASLRGTNNTTTEDACGLRIHAHFCQDYADEYKRFLEQPELVTVVPTEYYQVDWLSFAGSGVTSRGIGVTAALIDATSIRLQSGADRYLQQIITEQLSLKERVELARAYRSLRESFSENEAVATVNLKLSEAQKSLTDKTLSLSIDLSQRTAWEASLVPYLDDLPFGYVGSGGQNMLKVMLALNRAADDAHVLLVEEPENHQAPGSLNSLVSKMADRCSGKQVVVSTHSSFVLNKLGLSNLVLIGQEGAMRLEHLPADTLNYFMKLPGYDTLRVVLAEKVILVEGASDELLVQRAYHDLHGRSAMTDGVDVISVRGLSFARYLDIAVPLGKRVAVVKDNDGKTGDEAEAAFAGYGDTASLTLHISPVENGKTLEPQVLHAAGRELLNEVLGVSYSDDDGLLAFMSSNKTECALKLFSHPETVPLPQYIVDAVSD